MHILCAAGYYLELTHDLCVCKMNVNHVRTFGILFYFAFVSCSIQAQNMKTLKSPRGKEILEDSNIDYQSFIPTLLGGISNDITSLAEQTLNSTVLDSFEIGNSCLNHTKILLQALVSREQWALRSKVVIIIICLNVGYTVEHRCNHENMFETG